MKYEAYTDGSSRGNPGPAGWSCIVMSENKVREYAGGVNLGTNNQMEVYGVLFAMQFALANLNKNSIDTDEIHIWSDSEYTVKGCNQWLKGWVKNNWKNSQKKEVLNLNLWKSVNQAISDLEFKNIK
jgi:ribonuclease HI